MLVSMLAARHAALEGLKVQYPGVEDGVLLARMVAYCSKLVRKLYLRAPSDDVYVDVNFYSTLWWYS